MLRYVAILLHNILSSILKTEDETMVISPLILKLWTGNQGLICQDLFVFESLTGDTPGVSMNNLNPVIFQNRHCQLS